MGKKYFDTKAETLESSILGVWQEAAKKVAETNKNDKSDDGDGLDAVQPKAVKKKFKDRKDKDVDNDGDVDDSDKFLHKRRKAVSKAMKDEGNAFGKALKAAKEKGDKTFVVSGKTYEVKEEVDLDEDILPQLFMGGIAAAVLPAIFISMREIIRGTPLESSIKKIVDKLKKDKNYKISDSEKSDVKGFVSKVKKDKPSLLQKAMKKFKEEADLDEVEEGAAADARRAMKKDKDFSRRDSADDDNTATDDDVKAASKNIMMQMRKAVSMKGNFPVEFGDKKKVKIPVKIAQVVQQKYNSMKKPADKEKFQVQIAKSYKDMLRVLKAGYGEQKESILDRIDKKLKERKNG